MKNLIVLAALLLASALPAKAAPPLTYESVVRVTLPVVATSSAVYAFQNTSTGVGIKIHKIEISNASTMTVTGGTMQFWVYASTALTHSAAVTSNYNLTSKLVSQPSYITVSTAPTAIQAEGDSSGLLTGGALSGVPPIIRPFYVNNDEAATTLLTDSWNEQSEMRGERTAGPQPIILAPGDNRAIVIQQKRLGTADFAAGSIYIRVVYSNF